MRRAGALPGGHQSLGDRHRRVPDARARPLPQRRVRSRQTLQTGRLSQLQLHGPADGLRTISSLSASGRRRVAAAVPAGADRHRPGRSYDRLFVRDDGQRRSDYVLLVARQ